MSAPIPLRVLESAPEDMDAWEPGMMWPSELLDPDGAGYSVVICRQTDAAGNAWPIVWHTRQTADEPGDPRWQVTGDPPIITVHPSINVPGIWHGYIRDGELVEA